LKHNETEDRSIKITEVDAQGNLKDQPGSKTRANASGKDKRKNRRGTRGTREGSAGLGGSDDDEKKIRLPKRLVALLIGFCGTGCNGMQMCVLNPMFARLYFLGVLL
jgi:hypothetical protein